MKKTAHPLGDHWIQDPHFSSLEKPQNIHTFFRKCVSLAEISNAYLTFTADDVCKIFINGRFVVTGPAPGYLHHYYTQTLDVTDCLAARDNCIAVHTYYQGLNNRVWVSKDGLAGLNLKLTVTTPDGEAKEFTTDPSWKSFNCQAYGSDTTIGYDTQFNENIDLRLIPEDWQEVTFDDSSWERAVPAPDMPHVLVPQPTEPLSHYTLYPESIVRTVKGALIDFGKEVAGTTRLVLSGSEGQTVEVRHGEELTEDGRVRYELRANCTYRDSITLTGRKGETAELFDYKAFRYIELSGYTGELTPEDFTVHQRHYPFEAPARLKTKDKNLKAIWTICAEAVKLGTQDAYLDCLTREKGAYLGDAYVTGLSQLILTGKRDMLRKVIGDFAASATFCPGLRAVATSAFQQDIAEYSLMWIPLLSEFYRWTGDDAFAKEMLPVVEGVLSYFADYENDAGLLEDFTGKPVMVDWPQNLRDGYDDPNLMGGEDAKQVGINTLLNIHYYGTLTHAADCFRAVSESAREAGCREKAERLRQSLLTTLRLDGVFVDTDRSSHVSLHPNALALMFNLVDKAEAGPVIEVIREKRLSCGVYFSFFVLKGLFNYGEANLAYDLMTCDDEHSWMNMIKDGATTCMEAWGLEQKLNTSLCHPWASAPITMVVTELFGLAPGWPETTPTPKLPAAFPGGTLSLPTPGGRLTLTIDRSQAQDQITADTA